MRKVILFGTFDIVHMGHIHLFKEAKEYGDYLVVVVARDKNAELVKGFRPFHNEEERREYLHHLKIIDEVKMGCSDEDVYCLIREVQPSVVALGYDQRMYVDKLEDAITEANLNTKIVRLAPYQPDRYKSSNLRKYIKLLV